MRVWWVRVLGLGELSSGTGYAYLWSTAAADGTWTLPAGSVAALTYPTLAGLSDVASSDLRPLDALGGDETLTAEIILTADAAPLIRGTLSPAASSGGAMRTTAYAAPASTNIAVDDESGVTAPALVWCGREAMRVDSTAAGVLVVTRAQCASVAQSIPMSSLGGVSVGSPIYTTAPSAIGMYMEAGYSETGAGVAVTTWRGVVDAVSTSDSRRVAVRGRGLMADMRARPWLTPTAITWTCTSRTMYDTFPIGGYTPSLVGDPRDPGFFVDAGTWGASSGAQWAYVRVVRDDGRWVEIACTYAETLTVGGRLIARYTLDDSIVSDEIVQIGDSDGVLTLDGIDLALHVQAVLAAPITEIHAEYARLTTGTAQGIIQTLLEADEPPGTGGGLPSAWVDMGGLAYTAGSLPPPAQSIDGVSWVYPRAGDRKLLDALEADFLGPLGYGLAADDGQIVGVDWVPDTRTIAQSIGTDDARAVRWSWSRVGWEGARGAVLLQGRNLSRLVLGPRADALSISAGVYAVDARQWGDVAIDTIGILSARASAITSTYGLALPVVDLEVDTGTVERIGDLVSVERPDLVTPAGITGAPDCAGLVIRRSRSLANDVERLTILLIGWIDAPALRWGPSGEITSATSGSVTIAASAYTDDDAAVWSDVSLPDDVRILDADGAYSDTGTATVWDAGTRTLTITGMSGAPTAGQIVTLGAYSTASSANRALWVWLADTDGTTGADDGDPWGA